MAPHSIGRRQLNITVDERVYAKIAEMAKRAGHSPTSYAAMLFNAAYAARCGNRDDADLTATVSGTLLLHGAGLDTGAVAKTLRVGEEIVERILTAWQGWKARAA